MGAFLVVSLIRNSSIRGVYIGVPLFGELPFGDGDV